MMKLPEKPIDWNKSMNEDASSIILYIQKNNLLDKIADFNKNYYYWDELKYRVKDKTEWKYMWSLMRFLRSTKCEELKVADLKMCFTITSDISKKLYEFDKFLAGNIELQTKSLGLEKRYIISSLMEEAIASSILEGAATTRQAAKAMLRQKRKPTNKSEHMVVNGYETMQMIIKRKDEKLTPEFLLDIQRSITKETLSDDSDVGTYRNCNDVVVGSNTEPDLIYHIPPDCKKIPEYVKKICDFANDDKEFIHPIVKGSILHFLIGYVHPFNDGNGRTARSVFYWYVLSKGFWMFEYMSVSRRILRSKKNYGLAYLHTEYDDLDLTYFLKYVIVCIDDSLKDLLEYVKKKQVEMSEAKILLDKLNILNFRQASILEEMMKSPGKIFTIKEISETFHVVYQTARTDLLFLSKRGFINMKKTSKAFIFSFDDNNNENIKYL
jgi:Fic family protein